MLPTPTLQQEEKLVKSASATRIGFNRRCNFTLTDRRVIFKTLYSEEWYPLSHLKSVSQTGLFLTLEFDNGSSTTLSVFEAESWAALIEQTKTNAPEMAYQANAPSKSLLARTDVIILLLIGGMMTLCVFCMLAGFAFFYLTGAFN